MNTHWIYLYVSVAKLRLRGILGGDVLDVYVISVMTVSEEESTFPIVISCVNLPHLQTLIPFVMAVDLNSRHVRPSIICVFHVRTMLYARDVTKKTGTVTI